MTTPPTRIAVIGMACRLPGGASSPDNFWELLSSKGSGRTEVPADRWNREAFYHPHSSEVKESLPVKTGYFLQEDISKFDARFFNISPMEARALDPQQRILLETTYEAIENAGIPLEKIRGSDTSVFVGVFCRDYDRMGYKDVAEANKFHVTGSGDAMVANRISYVFDLKGPSITLDTGCSGSLVSLHQACQSLRSGESSVAIVGGAQLIISPDQSIIMGSVGMINPDGHCFTFDSRGDGYARGEGVATIILKPLEQAVADGDNIHAVIVNSGANQDGKTNGIMLPSGESQAALIRSVYAGAALDPADTLYVEAHGTGTKAGDKVEIGSISKVFCEEANRDTDLIVGSVKTNIGHLEATSGIAGFLKSILVLQHEAVPANLNFVKPKPTLQLENRKIKIPTELTPLATEGSSKVLRASVNSYGYGGTNCHVIVEPPPQPIVPARHSNGVSNGFTNGASNGVANGSPNGAVHGGHEEDPSQQIFVLSAASDKSLAAVAANLADWVAQEQPDKARLRDLAHTLNKHRSLLPWRRAVVASDAQNLIAELEEVTKAKPQGRAAEATKLAFVFTGQGAQWHAMGRELLMDSWRFRESIDKADKLLGSMGCSWTLVEELSREPSSSRVDQAEISQPATTAIQIALVDLLAGLGISPSKVIGHSSGEIAAAYAAGALSHEDAIEVAYKRGLCSALAVSGNEQKGSMLAVGLGEDDVQPYLECLSNGLATVACANSPESTTVSGDETAIDELKALLDAESVFARKLKVETAYHSHHMRTVAGSYLKSLAGLKSGPTKQSVKFYSTAQGVRKTDGFDATYWTHNLVSKVRFSEGVQMLWEDTVSGGTGAAAANIFVEIGPHAALAGPVRQILSHGSSEARFSYNSCLTRKQNATQTFLGLISRLVELGHNSINLAEVINLKSTEPAASKTQIVGNLKPYPWDQSQYWQESRMSRDHRFREFQYHDLVGILDPSSNVHEPRWKHFLDLDVLPWIRDHVVDGFVIFPGAGYLCMALEGMRQLHQMRKIPGTVSRYILKNVSFSKSIVFPSQSDGPTNVIEAQLALSPSNAHRATQWQSFRIFSNGQEGEWSEHSSGTMKLEMASKRDEVDGTREEDATFSANLDYLRDIQKDCAEELVPEDFYESLRAAGNDYGPLFSIVDKIWMGNGKCWATFKIPEIARAQPHVMHPVTFDAIYQVGAVLFKRFGTNAPVVPTTTGSIIIEAGLTATPGDEITVAMNMDPDERRSSAKYDFVAFQKDESGQLVPVLKCLEGQMRVVGETLDEEPTGPYSAQKMVYKMAWAPDMDLATAAALQDVVVASKRSQALKEGKLPEVEEIASSIRFIEQAASIYLRRALDVVSAQGATIESEHLGKLFAWTQKWCDSPECKDLLANLTPEQEDCILADAEKVGVEGRMLARIGGNLADIFLGKRDALTLMLEGNLLYEVYKASSLAIHYYQLAEYMKTLAFKNPNMAILEIGAGTGSTTLPLLEALTREDGQASLGRYTYTDISAGFFDAAQQTFGKWQEYMDFKVLDIGRDPLAQGLTEGSYDLVLASNVLHATSNMEVTVANSRKILKPGGRLILIEQTRVMALLQTIFGTLSGWWAFNDGRFDSPLLSTTQWGELLQRHGFNGLDFMIPDHDGATARSAMIVSKAVETDEAKNGTREPVEVVIVGGSGSPGSDALASNLSTALENRDIQCSRQAWNEVSVKQHITYIILSPSEQALLLAEDSVNFKHLQEVLTCGARVLYVGLQETESRLNTGYRGMIRGLARVVRRENADPNKLITMDVEGTIQDALQSGLVESLLRIADKCLWHPTDAETSPDREYGYKNGRLLIPRLQTDTKFFDWVGEGQTSSSTTVPTQYHQADRPLKLVVKTPGLLGSLHFDDDDVPLSVLGTDEIQVSARAHGVNFKDVFIALGQMLPGVKMVGEVAGVVTAVGDSMKHLYNVGDRVVATGAQPFASQARLPGLWAQKMPESMSFATGASIPTIFMTAYYCLFDVAHLQKGQSILIHAASGGVGQAAIQLAQHVGAEIFCTVGSAAKRQLLIEEYGISSDHIFSTRTGTFKKALLRLTKNRGVDVVLNSLAGEQLTDGWECVAPLGKFVEIGKADIYRGSFLSMVPFDKSITFASVDLIAIRENIPEKIRNDLAHILDLFEKRILRPVTHINTLPIGSLQEGFRLIESRKHTGKIVLETPEDATVQATKPKVVATGPKLKKDGTYVIAGGLGDLGRRIAKFLASHGAGHIITLSRRTLDDVSHAALTNEIKELGATLHTVRCDISSTEDMQKTVEYCADLPPVRGIVHCGMVLKDRPFANMDHEDYTIALKPKVYGTINLDKAFASTDLNFFITVSSIVSILGNMSQGNYAAGNSFQDAFATADHPHTQYISLNLGAVAGSDSVSDPAVEAALTRLGVIFLSFEELLKSIEYIISPKAKEDGCVQMVTGFTRESLLNVGNTASANETLFNQLPIQKQKGDGKGSKDENSVEQKVKKAQNLVEAEEVITEAIISKFALFLDKSPEDIVPSESLNDMGLDSLVSIELKNWMARTFQMSLHTTEMTNAPSIFALAALVASRSKLVTDEVRDAKAPVDADAAKPAKPDGTNGTKTNGTNGVNGSANVNGMNETNGVNGASTSTTNGTKVTGTDGVNGTTNGITNGTNGASSTSGVKHEKSVKPTHQHRCCSGAETLPRHPLVDFDDAIKRIEEDIVSTAQTEEEATAARSDLQELARPDGLARQVYQQLVTRANDPNCDSWLADTVLHEAYLKQRSSLAPGGNYLLTHFDAKVPHTQAERASIIAAAAFSICKDIETGVLSKDSLEGKPLCTDGWLWLFNTVRQPGLGSDEMKKYAGHHHCAVLRRGHLFKVQLDSRSRHDLQLTFEAILNTVQETAAWTGLLTTDNRESWAMNRTELIGLDPKNEEYFRVIESAAFVLCLDEGSPATRLEKVEQGLLRTSFNRWHDKGAQFIVFANGQSASIFEHTLIDGLTTVHLIDRITEAIAARGSSGQNSSTGAASGVKLDGYPLKTTTRIENHMLELRDRYLATAAPRDYAYYNTDLLGREFLFEMGAPIKSCIDLAIQLALRLYFGENPPTFQAVSTQHYHRGRPEPLQVVTKSVIDFCVAATDDSIPAKERRALLARAAKEWSARERAVTEGKGYGFLMAAVHAYLGAAGPQYAELRNSPIWPRIIPWGLKVMQGVKADNNSDSAGLHPSWDPEAIWTSYTIRPEGMEMSIIGPVGKTDRFQECMNTAARTIRSLLAEK